MSTDIAKDIAKYKSTFLNKIRKEGAGSSAHFTQHVIRSQAMETLDLHHALVQARKREDLEEQKNIQRKLGAFQCVFTAHREGRGEFGPKGLVSSR